MPELLPWHQTLWEQWQQRLKTGRAPHALLLKGPEGLGKRHFADYLSQGLICHDTSKREPCGVCQACQWAMAGSYPDIHIIQPEETEKRIRVAAIREMIHQSSLAAATWRIFMIQPADKLTGAAANALLKTLEEPSAQTLIILISALPQQLPATIRSRCQNITFYPATQAQSLAWLQNQDPDANWVDLLAYTGNSPLLALQAKTAGWLNEAHQTLQQLIDIQTNKTNPVEIAKHWGDQALTMVLKTLQCVCQDLIHHAMSQGTGRLFFPGQQVKLIKLARQLDVQSLLAFNQTLIQSQKALSHNLNPAMLLHRLAIEWFNLNSQTRKL